MKSIDSEKHRLKGRRGKDWCERGGRGREGGGGQDNLKNMKHELYGKATWSS